MIHKTFYYNTQLLFTVIKLGYTQDPRSCAGGEGKVNNGTS